MDKKSHGVAKSRLTCTDVKQKQNPQQRLSSEGASNFCPTPHPASLKLLEVYSLLRKYPRVKADLTSAFLIARDSGDDQGQPTCLRPPKEWLDQFETWLVDQNEQTRKELGNVPKDKIVWQVDGNIYGRQPAAAAYRQELDNILTSWTEQNFALRAAKWTHACHCSVTGIVLVHRIDDFDVCGPAESVKELLEVQLPKFGRKLKIGDFEGLEDDIGTSIPW